MPLCVSAVDCGSPEGAGNADIISLTSTTYNTSVTYRCMSGYWFYRGVFTLTSICQADAQWSQLKRRTCTRKSTFIFLYYEIFNMFLEVDLAVDIIETVVSAPTLTR